MKPFVYVLMAVVILFSCSPYPRYSYYELDAAIANAETEEEREYHRKRRESIEKTAMEAGEFLRQLRWCNADINCQVLCSFYGITPSDAMDPDPEDVKGVDKLVKWYAYVRPPTCGFVIQGMFP